MKRNIYIVILAIIIINVAYFLVKYVTKTKISADENILSKSEIIDTSSQWQSSTETSDNVNFSSGELILNKE